jgi:hypothetical protein
LEREEPYRRTVVELYVALSGAFTSDMLPWVLNYVSETVIAYASQQVVSINWIGEIG